MATRTFTSAGVNNLWSNAANWDGGTTTPADGDSVTIPAGQTCEFNVDLSAWVTGVAGITIAATGTLSLTRTTGTYYLMMKAGVTIGGAGTFDCGTVASPIPFAAKHTITGGTGWYIKGNDTGGLTMTVYAAEPAIKTILLSGDEAIGQTELSVDTDVTGDIWAVGDTIRINDINKAVESEERIIAVGGIAAGTITVTAGLTAAKSTGAVIVLCTRNVKFIGVGGRPVQNFGTGKLTVAGGSWTAPSQFVIYNSNGTTVSGGVFYSSSDGLNACDSSTISGGVFTGLSYAYRSSNTGSITGGTFTGNSTCLLYDYGLSISGGVFKGNNYCVASSIGITVTGGEFDSNTGAFLSSAGANIFGGTYTNNTSTIYEMSAILKNCSMSANSRDVYLSQFTAFNALFGSTVEVLNYKSMSKATYSESIDHDQVAGAYKAWTAGGITTKQAVTYPTGYTDSMQTVLESATNEGYWQKEVTVGAGASANITMYLRKDASMTYLPNIIVFNKSTTDPFAGGTGLYTFTMTDLVDTWEDDLYTYTNSTDADITLIIRAQGKNATGNLYSVIDVEQINVDLTTTLANIATIDTVVDAIKAKTDVLKNPSAIIDGEVIV